MTHSPAPWYVKTTAEYGDTPLIYSGTTRVAVLSDGDLQPATGNARLIAAAPDLLAVCQAVAERYNVDDRLGGLGDWLVEAIAKATGGAV